MGRLLPSGYPSAGEWLRLRRLHVPIPRGPITRYGFPLQLYTEKHGFSASAHGIGDCTHGAARWDIVWIRCLPLGIFLFISSVMFFILFWLFKAMDTCPVFMDTCTTTDVYSEVAQLRSQFSSWGLPERCAVLRPYEIYDMRTKEV